MIYETVDPLDPIRQGDIFKHVPRVDMKLSELPLIDDSNEIKATSWRDVVSGGDTSKAVSALLAIKPVMGVVITQDCDASRGYSVSLCQVDEYLAATGQASPKNAKGWQSLLMKFARTNTRFFYLPEDPAFSIGGRLAADFRMVIPVPRPDLEAMRDLRVGRLNATAIGHFREAISHFFRRYAYNEWYPLTKDEFKEYSSQFDEDIQPFDWQK